jgi:hypothetical protein
MWQQQRLRSGAAHSWNGGRACTNRLPPPLFSVAPIGALGLRTTRTIDAALAADIRRHAVAWDSKDVLVVGWHLVRDANTLSQNGLPIVPSLSSRWPPSRHAILSAPASS